VRSRADRLVFPPLLNRRVIVRLRQGLSNWSGCKLGVISA
jgi:hypothetical protein